MRAPRTIAAAGLLALLLCASAQPAQAARSCITTIAGDTCLAQCIGQIELICGSDPECHQVLAQDLQFLATARAGTLDCAFAVAAAQAACGCS
jgi:hypothetical protein